MSTPLSVIRLAHATQLITIGNLRVLTDPWFTQTATYYHGESLAGTAESLGEVDALVIGHGLHQPLPRLQVVMDAQQAAELTAVLKPALTLPHRYAFHSGRLGDQMITKGDQDPRHFTDALARVAPGLTARIVLPGTEVVVP